MKRLLTSTLIAATLSLSMQTASAEVPSELDAAIEKYILTHPEVLLKSLKSYKGKQAVTSEQYKKVIDNPDHPILGNPNGDVTLVEFFDYHCGFCKRFFPIMSQLIAEDKNLKVVFVELPIISEDSPIAAKAALAVFALDKSKYFSFHTALMKLSGKFEESKMVSLAKQAGLNEQMFIDMMKSDKISQQLADNKALAEQLEVQATPTLLVGTKLVPGFMEIDKLRSTIAMARGGDEKK